jgi:hypothetical protein
MYPPPPLHYTHVHTRTHTHTVHSHAPSHITVHQIVASQQETIEDLELELVSAACESVAAVGRVT